MVWTAQVTNKFYTGGFVNVTVEYTDGQETITETYKSKGPNAEWIPKTVRNRISQIESLYEYDIPMGTVTPADPITIADPDQLLFARRCRLLETVKIMIDLGVVQADNAKVVALVNWIKNNFNNYFESLV